MNFRISNTIFIRYRNIHFSKYHCNKQLTIKNDYGNILIFSGTTRPVPNLRFEGEQIIDFANFY
jgi:hypothetical protein